MIQTRLSVYPYGMRRAFLLFSWSAVLLTTPLLFGPRPAHAWYDHVVVMKEIQTRLMKEVPLSAGSWENRPHIDSSSLKDDYAEAAALLLLQPKAELKSAQAKTYIELLGLSVEDPDHGLDRDLPDSADPNDDRRFMGGSKGASSQGFRHMYWPGWNWKRPIATFQIPTHALGQSPDRIELLANEARERIRKGDAVWGIRILGWALHYLQDLTQPFHAVQFPSLEMIPLTALFSWPPASIFPNLVKESTRVVTNYHWAYEGYVRHALLSETESPFKNCFATSGGSLLVTSPRELALEVIDRSIKRAPMVGAALMDFVGNQLKSSEVTVPLDPKLVDNEDLLKNPRRESARTRLNAETCESFRLATDASIWLTRWVSTKPTVRAKN